MEDVFKRKCGLFMDKIPRRAVAKFVYASVLTLAILVRGFREKKALQRLAEW